MEVGRTAARRQTVAITVPLEELVSSLYLRESAIGAGRRDREEITIFAVDYVIDGRVTLTSDPISPKYNSNTSSRCCRVVALGTMSRPAEQSTVSTA